MSDWLQKIESELDRLTSGLDLLHPIIKESVRYALLDAGKRVRPNLVRMFFEACYFPSGALGMTNEEFYEKQKRNALACACAVEMVHTYSLIHDDLPCMDDDDLRRSKPSCHKKFDEATALLAGDALQALAFETILTSDLYFSRKVMAALELARQSGANGMVGGQIVDLQSEGHEVDINTLRKMHQGKTCALIEAACVMGVYCTGAASDETKIKMARDYAYNIGMAFQIVDDILDETATTQQLGKPAGSDKSNQKSTYVSLFGIEQARETARDHTEKAVEAIASLGEKGEELRQFAVSLFNRIN